jgi:hypothetical protein
MWSNVDVLPGMNFVYYGLKASIFVEVDYLFLLGKKKLFLNIKFIYLVRLTPISKALVQSKGNTSFRLWAFFWGSNLGANTFE